MNQGSKDNNLKSRCLFPLSLCLILACCQTRGKAVFHTNRNLEEIAAELQSIELDFTGGREYTAAVHSYFAFYSMDLPGAAHYYGGFPSAGKTIMAHVYLPPGARETVYICHGFLSHAGLCTSLIRVLVSHGFAVAICDLPGHGFSSGSHTEIGDFGEYVVVLNDFITRLENHAPPPAGVIGLSTGSAIILEYLRSCPTVFRHHILGAPLIRSDKWELSKLGNALVGWLIPRVPTFKRDCTSDPVAKEFMYEQDPLRRKSVSMTWVRAMYAWEADLSRAVRITALPVVVIQGDRDVIVQWQHNLAFLKERIPCLTVHMIAGARHELFLETEALRGQVFGIILEELLSGWEPA